MKTLTKINFDSGTRKVDWCRSAVLIGTIHLEKSFKCHISDKL